jgi:predicted ATPase/GAF domain-containing protein/tRNA A-37 threonylcarbamoyl transferase component Bud32/two-component sensor histidine kinase
MVETIAGYELGERLFSGQLSTVYRGTRGDGRETVIIKVLDQKYPTAEQMARLRHEYAIASRVAMDGMIKVFALEKHGNTLAILMEDMGGIDLGQWIRNRQPSLSDFFPLAIRLVDILDGLHRQGILHKDINPSNILINQRTGDLRLIDFGIASDLAVERQQATNLTVLEGTLAYMAPEQTGRMNRPVDYRADYYSLGATFYQLLTGSVLFSSLDPLEIVHSHLARTPRAPSDLNPRVPPALSGIVLKLLAKGAEDRYQSAAGLKADLERCQDLCAMVGGEVDFPLGQQDISDHFHLPQKLYGRASEIETLYATFDRTRRGAAELVLVAGYSGVGKTALIEEARKPLAGGKGYFISGKFEQYRRETPYASIIAAFQGLIRQLLTERDEQIQDWRAKLLDALGGLGRIITDTIPDVEAIIGSQPALDEIGAAEAEKRFTETFARFIQVFCQEEHSLLLFLDDLQWADSASLKLIRRLMAGQGEHHLLIIGAYRDNEVSSAHPLVLAIEDIQKNKRVETIFLKPLDGAGTRDLVADTVGRSDEEVDGLAGLIFRKTKGNPFFINRLLSTIHDQGLLWFDTERRGWSWDPTKINEMQVSDNIVELMVKQLRQLPPDTRSCLLMSSCLGGQFDARMISVVSGQSLHDIIAALSKAVREDLIVPVAPSLRYAQWITEEDGPSESVSTQYRFCHDRIHEAAYSQLSNRERLETHHRIGMAMLESVSECEIEEHLFDIVDQLNKSAELLVEDADRARVARLNLDAATRARASVANGAALAYLDAGIGLLGETGWISEHRTMFDLYYNKTECEFLCGHLARSEQSFDITISHARDNFEKLATYELMMRIHLTSNKFSEGLRLAREALNLYGMALAFDDPKVMAVLANKELEAVEARLANRDLKSLLEAPLHGDEELGRCFAILFRVWTLCFLGGNLPTMNYAGLKIVSLTLDKGNDKYSSFGYIVYAMILVAEKESYGQAYEFGMLAMDMNRHLGNVAAIPPINNLFGHIISHYNMHYCNIVDIFQESYDASLRSGEVEWGVWAVSFIYLCPFIEGRHLNATIISIDKFYEFLRQSGSESILHLTKFHRNLVLNLKGETESAGSIDTQSYREEDLVEYLESSEFEYGWLWYYLYRSFLFYQYGDYAKALEYSLKAEEKKIFAPAFMKYAEQTFYHALILAGSGTSLPVDKQQETLIAIDGCCERLEKWANSCPENYRHKYLLVSAERARLRGEGSKADDLFDAAIQSARENEYTQNEALANELAALSLIGRGKETAAQGYLIEAHYLYERWGALRKAEQLRARYPSLARRLDAPTGVGVSTTKTGTMSLDLVAIINASQALSAEVNLGRVLESLMRILQENAGAQNARLLLRTGETWRMEADLSGRSIEVLQSRMVLLNAPADEQFPLLLLRYVARSAANAGDSRAVESQAEECGARGGDGRIGAEAVSSGVKAEDAGLVVIDDLSADPTYRHDPYVVKHQPKSVLCLPVRNRNRLVCILYLENNLATGVFNPERVELLGMISSQVAISIDNARLYDHLETQVTERTAELRLAKEDAEQAQARVANLLDHSGQGFLSFNASLVVDPNYSRACVAMLGEVPALKDATQVLFGDDTRKAELFRLGAGIVFKERDPYQREVILSLFPNEICRDSRILSVTYTPLDNGHIMTVLTDITEERRLEETVRKEHRGLQMVVAAVTENRDFCDAVVSFQDYLDRGLATNLQSGSDARDVLEKVYREVHTFKGTLNQFSFLNAPEALHVLEEELAELSRDSEGVTVADIGELFAGAGLSESFEKDLKGLRQILGDDFLEGGARVSLTATQAVMLEQLASSLLKGDPVDVTAAEMRRLLVDIGYLRKVPLRDVMISYERVVRQVAARLEKEVGPMRVEGGHDVWVNPEQYEPFLRSLAHLFRNSVTHGIEDPDDRVSVGKGEEGNIACSIKKEGASIVLLIEDDGCGIDVDGIRRRALEAGLVDAVAINRLSREEAIDLIFLDRMTTKKKADLFSGRGVGLSAVRAEVKRLGGSVTVRTEQGQGTSFVITLPLSSETSLTEIVHDQGKV